MRHFFRLSGGGNDFLALAEPLDDPTPAQIRAWCHRGLSLGADGLFLLHRSPDGAQMRLFQCRWQPCGSVPQRYAVRSTSGSPPGLDRQRDRHRNRGGSSSRDRLLESYLRNPGPPATGRAQASMEIDVDGDPIPGIQGSGRRSPLRCCPGQTEWLELRWPRLGQRLRSDPVFGDAGTNVDFVHFADRNRMDIRTFERGVESETLACGTGVMASVAVGVAQGELELPVTVLTRGGFPFRGQQLDQQSRRSSLGTQGRCPAAGGRRVGRRRRGPAGAAAVALGARRISCMLSCAADD